MIDFWADCFLPIVAAVLLWWGSTGIIIYLTGRKAWRPYIFAAITAVQPLAFWQLHVSRNFTSVGNVFAAFFWAVVIWSWIECSYYTGFVVGRKVPELEPDAPIGPRFRAAVAANLYHEIAIIVLSIVVIGLGWSGYNDTGLWTFMILHWTHQSAKFNIFLGVNNLTTDFLPENLRYMAQYFVKKPLNSLFPFSVTATTIFATALFISTLHADSSGQLTGQALLCVMMCAAVLEHWWLVTPVPTKIWDWSIKSRQKAATQNPTVPILIPSPTLATAVQTHIICGYLGSGKTTLIRHLLPQLSGRVAVVVNDFGSVGIDADLIKADGQAGAVVELPGGCVCCTLQNNLSGQLLKLIETYQPERILIEPSGVAGIEQILKAIAKPGLFNKLGQVEVVAVVEASRLLDITKLPTFVQTQIKVASAVVINKTDLLAQATTTASLQRLVAAINPGTRVLDTVHGRVDANALFGLTQIQPDADEHDEHTHDEENGFISFGREYDGLFESVALRQLFNDLAANHFGPVSRAKGLFHTAEGWQLWELASGNVSYELLSPTSFEQDKPGRFMAVASDLASEELNRQLLQACKQSGSVSATGSEPRATS